MPLRMNLKQQVLVSLDCTEEVVIEAERTGCQMIVSHHPVIFGGLKRLNGGNDVECTVMRAIRSGIALYAIHTNLDNVLTGVNRALAESLGCLPESLQILRPKEEGLEKWSVFVPEAQADAVRSAMAEAGAGHLGNYDKCSFQASGVGTFRALKGANPHVGELGELHREPEVKLEMAVPSALARAVEAAMTAAHPYEEIAFDRVSLVQTRTDVGSGMVGELAEAMPWGDSPSSRIRCMTWMESSTPMPNTIVPIMAVKMFTFTSPLCINSGCHKMTTATGTIV